MKSLLANILITIDLMSCRTGRNLIIVFLLIVGFALCGMTLICVNISDYDRIEYKKQCDITRTGFMLNDNVSEDINVTGKFGLATQQPYQQFYNNLKKSGLVEKCAQYSTLGQPDVDKDIVEIQNSQPNEGGISSGGVSFTYVQKDLFDLYNIKVEPKVKQEDWSDGGVILGNKFKEKYNDAEFIDFKENKCKLLGFIEDNQLLSFEDVAYKEETTLTGLHNLDYAFFYLTPEDFYTGSEIHFRLAEGVTRDEFKKKVNEMVKKDNAKIISMYFVDEHLAELKKSNIDVLGPIIKYAIRLLVGIILICIFAKIYSIFCNKKLYGILYSSGLSTNQINSLFIIENVIILFFSLIISYLCLYYWIYNFCDYFGQAPYMIVDAVKSVLVSKVFLQEFLLCLFMVIITSAIPMIVFSKLSPLSMMRDFHE